MPVGVNSTQPIEELENLEDLADIWEHPNKGIEKPRSVTETNSKVHKPKIYKQAIFNLVYARQWKKVIKE